MNKRPEYILWGDDVIGNISAYPALPKTPCHSCGSQLYRVYNTQTEWKYLCMEEKLLVDPDNPNETLSVEVG
jgi:hypothetical protein